MRFIKLIGKVILFIILAVLMLLLWGTYEPASTGQGYSIGLVAPVGK